MINFSLIDSSQKNSKALISIILIIIFAIVFLFLILVFSLIIKKKKNRARVKEEQVFFSFLGGKNNILKVIFFKNLKKIEIFLKNTTLVQINELEDMFFGGVAVFEKKCLIICGAKKHFFSKIVKKLKNKNLPFQEKI